MAKMSKEEIIRFLMQGTFTGKLATTRKDSGAHVVPIWYVLDNKNSKDQIGSIVFEIYDKSVEAKTKVLSTKVSMEDYNRFEKYTNYAYQAGIIKEPETSKFLRYIVT